MDIQIHTSTAPISTKTSSLGLEDARRSVTYHPTVWGDYFLSYTSNLTDIPVEDEQKRQILKEEVKKLLAATSNDSSHKLDLIDAIQRLGVGYHFETDIEESLKHVYDAYHKSCNKQDDDLHIISLRFRLLRQQGHCVSCDVFEKFKDHEGKFDKELISDVQGLLSLYEAARFRVHDEEILEETLKFSTAHLKSMIHHVSINDSLSRRVREALEMPIRRTLTRVGAKRFLSIFQESDHDVLLNFAKLDFNILQKLHQKELSEITRWWKHIEFGEKISFAGDRIAECYFWILSIYHEPQYSLARKFSTKLVAMTSIIDDIFDVYGTLNELELFTNAIQRWNISPIDQLPEYMKYFYKYLLNIYVEAEEELGNIRKSTHRHYEINKMKKLVQASLDETKWTYNGYIPTLEEYMKVALITIAYTMISTACLVGMRDHATKEALDWITSETLLVRSTSVICKLMDDIVGDKIEPKITAIGCYMKEKGASEEEAIDALESQITYAWKDVTQECLITNVVPMTVLPRVVNLSSFIDLLYKDEDSYTNSKTKFKGLIMAILIHPMTSTIE